ncbi:MAG: hypothetical protein M3R37_04400 [Actinomycetota bacterium]|nr:hypothetical protein [Actinomycetota bacterium]
MRRPLLLAAALTALLLFPAAATAKGPSAATIAGPGLAHMLTINGSGEGSDASPLGILVTETGLFAQAFKQTPVATTRSRPADRLGPRYDVTYTVPGPNGDSTLRQALYPYAVNGPASYMTPGQKFWGSESAPGGWYRGSAALKSMLVQAGLPAAAPTKRTSRAQAHKRAVAVGAGAGVALAAGALGLLYRRRRSGPH